MTHTLALFASTFALVFALGIQSQAVNRGQFRTAFINSFLIGSGQLILYKLAPNASGLEIAAFLAGGPFGIVTSMFVHRLMTGEMKFEWRVTE